MPTVSEFMRYWIISLTSLLGFFPISAECEGFRKCTFRNTQSECKNNWFSSKRELSKDTECVCSTDKNIIDSVNPVTGTECSKMTTSLAVVPYDESKVLPHEKPRRHFAIAGHEFTIQQNWQQLGVAAVVWDSAVVLVEYLHKHQDLIKNKRVLELGAGTGLTGLVAAALGADVMVTERAEALSHLTSSVESNLWDQAWKISAQVLDWTEKVDVQSFGHIDVILGADIIYIEETFQDLLRTIDSLAVSRDVLILLSCRLRYDRDLHFLKMLDVGYVVEEVYNDEARQIKIFSARKRI